MNESTSKLIQVTFSYQNVFSHGEMVTIAIFFVMLPTVTIVFLLGLWPGTSSNYLVAVLS